MNLYALANLLTSLFSILLGIFVFLKGKNKLINKTFSLWALSVGIWSFGIYRHALAVDSFSAMFWSQFLHGAAIFIPTLFFQFTLSLIQANKISKKILLFMYLFSLAFFFINFSNFSYLFILDIRPILTFKYFPRAGIIYPFFVIFFRLFRE